MHARQVHAMNPSISSGVAHRNKRQIVLYLVSPRQKTPCSHPIPTTLSRPKIDSAGVANLTEREIRDWLKSKFGI